MLALTAGAVCICTETNQGQQIDDTELHVEAVLKNVEIRFRTLAAGVQDACPPQTRRWSVSPNSHFVQASVKTASKAQLECRREASGTGSKESHHAESADQHTAAWRRAREDS